MSRADRYDAAVGLLAAHDTGHLAHGPTLDSDTPALLDLVRKILRSERWPV